MESSDKVNFLHSFSPEAGYFLTVSRSTNMHRRHQLWSYELPRVSVMNIDHRHASPVHGLNKAVY